jgi:cupin fold WbuC family metalloprotein
MFKLEESVIQELRDRAVSSDLKRSRICIHEADHSPSHQMLVFLLNESAVKPHYHTHYWESYLVLRGELKLCVQSTAEKCIQFMSEGAFIKIDPFEVHQMSSNTPYCVYLETTAGPFNRSNTIWLDHYEWG